MNIKKLLIGLAVVAMVFSVSVASAATIAELQAMIADLTAQIAALGGTSPQGSAIQYNTNLTLGSTGADVTALQQFLVSKGMLQMPVNVSYGYFGVITQAALARYQASVGIAPAVGYFGPLTRANLNSLAVPPTGGTLPAGCTSTAGYSVTTGVKCDSTVADDDDDTPSALEGGAGSVSEYSLTSGIQNEKVGEDEEDQEVYGLDIEADDSSDIEITAIRLVFDEGAAATASDFDNYAADVSVWLDGEEFARVDGDVFTSDNNWTKTVSLDDGAIIRAGETGELVVKVSGVNNLDTNDATDTWTLDPSSIRFVDARGDSTAEDPGTGARTFSFETFATAVSAVLKISSDDQSINNSTVIDVASTDDTPDVPVLSFKMQASGDSDLKIKDMTASTTVTGATNVDALVKEITLWIEGEEVASGVPYDDRNTDSDTGVGTVEDYFFDDVDYTIPAGETVDAEIRVTFNGTDDTGVDEGDTLQVNINEDMTDQTALWDVRDETNTRLADADITGSVQGGAHSIYNTGINVEFVSASRAVTNDADTANTDTGEFIIKYKVTAFGGTVYVADQAEVTIDVDAIEETTTDESLYYMTIGGTATAAGLSDDVAYTTTDGASDSTNGNIELADGESTVVTLSVFRTNTAANPGGSVVLKLQGVAWSATDTAYSNGTESFDVYDFNLTDFKTAAMSLN